MEHDVKMWRLYLTLFMFCANNIIMHTYYNILFRVKRGQQHKVIKKRRVENEK